MLPLIVFAIFVIFFAWAFVRLDSWSWGIVKKASVRLGQWLRTILKKLGKTTTSDINHVSEEENRWIIVGLCLIKMLTPALRNALATEIPKWYHSLCQPPIQIDKQVHSKQQKTLAPSTLKLNYKNINNNNDGRKPSAFDYAVTDPLSLAKLFIQPSMLKFNGFDETMDLSAILSIICEAAPFAGAAAHASWAVRSDIRNEWAHCSNFANWTEAKFNTDFQTMETLLKSVKLSSEDEQRWCDEMNIWRSKGLQPCLGQDVDIEMLTDLRDQVNELSQAVKTWNLGKEEMTKQFSKGLSELSKKIDNLHAIIEKKYTTVLSTLKIKEEEKIPYVFTAPSRNSFFAGRTEEIQELNCILQVEKTMNEKKVRVAAVCGLGGIGKTSLVSEYAHQMKDFYKGGVYWFSAENDAFLEKSVNEIASQIDPERSSFDFPLSVLLKRITCLSDPALFVLDCLDQPELSSSMIKLLSFLFEENSFGHFVIISRRSPNRLDNDVSFIQEDCCLQLECFQPQEAKKFLMSRANIKSDEKASSVAESLCEELGRLPLALEQAGAGIKMLRRCSLSSYLKHYKIKRLQLLNEEPARRVSDNESRDRLAIDTTWRINMEHLEKSRNGPAAVRFMNACSFFNGNEIEEELINVGTPEVEDDEYRNCVSLPAGPSQILKLLTDFSLFTCVQAHSVRTHRLVQELVKERFNTTSKAESCTDALRMLSYAFSKCPSPGNLFSSNESGEEQSCIYASDLLKSHSQFYMWSKFCMHAHHLRKELEDLLLSLESDQFLETSKIVFECALHLSVNHKQEEARRTLNFAYRMLDWPSFSKYEAVQKIVLEHSMFPLSIPVQKSFPMVINGCCMPPPPSLQSLTGPPDPGSSRSVTEEEIEKLKLDGNKFFKEDRYEEALDAYSSAIKLAKEGNNAFFKPLLLTNRATVYIKLKRYEDALKDANDYIIRCPECWKGYARKALALYGLNEKVSAEIAAALAFYHSKDSIFSKFSPFKESFVSLQKRIFICDSVDELQEAIHSEDINEGELKILVLGSEEYILKFDMVVKPWNDCVLVGTKKDCSVSLKSDNNIVLLKCMLTNLSFYFSKGCVLCIPGSFVKTLNCNFITCDYTKVPAVGTEGNLSAEQCNFTSIYGCGLACVGPANAVVVECSFCNNGEAGVFVNQGATLLAKRCRFYGNYHGLHIIKNNKSKCDIIYCDICNNCESGIFIVDSKNVTLLRNSVFGNDLVGIFMVNSEVGIKENNVFDNGMWGIWSQSNSWCNILVNKVFRNGAGGVRVGYRAECFSPSVIKMNNVYDNTGIGFMEIVNDFEVCQSSYGLNEDLRMSWMKSTNSFTCAKFEENEERNNKKLGEMVETLNLSVPYCSNCRKKCDPKICEKCFSTAYCSAFCRKEHSSKHKRVCKVLREKSSYLISSMERPEPGDGVVEVVEAGKDTRRKSRFRLPRNGIRFVVKVRSVLTLGKSYKLMLYDYNFRLHKTFNSRFIDKLVKEFGVLCDRQCLEKKLFFYCMFEDKGQLRLFTNEFPKFESW